MSSVFRCCQRSNDDDDDEARANERGWRACMIEKEARVWGQRVQYYSPAIFWRCGVEEVVDLESTGRLRVEARQERYQSLLSRSLTCTQHRWSGRETDHVLLSFSRQSSRWNRRRARSPEKLPGSSSVGPRRSSGSRLRVTLSQQDFYSERNLGNVNGERNSCFQVQHSADVVVADWRVKWAIV